MKHTRSNFKFLIPLEVCFILLLAIFSFSSRTVFPTAYAAAGDVQTAFESRNVLNDLEEMTVNGEPFNFDQYPHAAQGKPQVITFVEYCFPYYNDNAYDFGLYLLVYNPTQTPIDVNETGNTVQMSVGRNYEEHNYPLRILNCSTEKGSEYRFYKLKILLTLSEEDKILQSVDINNREYRLTDLQLYTGGELQHSLQSANGQAGMKVTYSGFAEGFGSATQENAPLTCKTDGLDHVISLDLNHTYYRANGDFYRGEQSQLNSVFFRIPNYYLNDFGDLTEVLCEWYEYFTKPIIATNNAEVVNYFDWMHGRSNDEVSPYPASAYKKDIAIKYKTADNRSSWFVNDTDFQYYLNNPWDDEYRNGRFSDDENGSQQMDTLYGNFLGTTHMNPVEHKEINSVAGAFYSSAGDISSYTVSIYNLVQKLKEYSGKLSGTDFVSGYNLKLFEDYVYPGHTLGFNHKAITADADFTLTWNTVTQKFWDKIFSGKYQVDSTTQNIRAFEFIDDNDLAGEANEIADRLFINALDVSLLRSEYEKAQKNDETVVLMRYSSTSYFSFPGYCNTGEYDLHNNFAHDLIEDVQYGNYEKENWNCFIFQESVFLGFDVISLTFEQYGVETVVPVSAVPSDVFSDGTPPLDPGVDKDGCLDGLGWIVWVVLGVIALILILILCPQIIVAILKIIVWVILLPFKAIDWVVKKISEAIRRRRQKREAERPAREAAKKAKANARAKKKSTKRSQSQQRKKRTSSSKVKAKNKKKPAAKKSNGAGKRTRSYPRKK